MEEICAKLRSELIGNDAGENVATRGATGADGGDGQHQESQPEDNADVPGCDAGVHDAGHDRRLQEVADGFHSETRERRKERPEVSSNVGTCEARA